MLRQTLLTLAVFTGICAVGLSTDALAQDGGEELISTSAPLPAGAGAGTTALPSNVYTGAPIPIGYQSPGGPMAYGRQWAHTYGTQDWARFYHYPYVFYPQNFWGSDYYRSAEHLYYRYPPEMRIPVYNKQWHNYYPEAANWDRYIGGYFQHTGPPTGGRYHMGHHFILDTF